jgi:hypothetical protein
VSERYLNVLPSAGRLMSSLRDIGYDLPSAIADLVDNAIDAGACHVAVDLVPDGIESWIRVSDDGLGMTSKELDEAMRYGTHTQYDHRALGHFGLGLKTASLSQCRRLTVSSRAREGGRIAVRRWDLDEVTRRDSWDLQVLSATAAGELATAPIRGLATGTVVLWQHIDRVLPRKPTSGMTARVLATASEDVRRHLAMVFHRFLDGEAFGGRKRLELLVNGEAVDAWDPYARSQEHTRALRPQVVQYDDSDGRTIAIEVEPFILPAQQLFSSADAHREAGGPRRWNRHQGFYIYRRDRLIQAGGWNRLRTLDEHAKLARIALDLPVGDEDRFAVDVAKGRVSIPEELRPGLRAIASGAVAAAQERYRDHLDASAEASTPRRETPTIEAISISRDWPVILSVVGDVLSADAELRDRLLLRLANADPDEVATISAV